MSTVGPGREKPIKLAIADNSRATMYIIIIIYCCNIEAYSISFVYNDIYRHENEKSKMTVNYKTYIIFVQE